MRNFFKIFVIFSLVMLANIPVFATEGVLPNRGVSGSGASFSNVTINNPLNIQSIQGLISGILKVVIAIGTPIAILALVWIGFQYIWARGDSGAIKKLHNDFLWVVIGIVVLLGAELLAKVLEGTIKQLGVGIF